MVGEGPFCEQKVPHEQEVQRDRAAHGEYRSDFVGDLRRLVDRQCDPDHRDEDDEPIGMLTCRVEKDDMKDLEDEGLCPRIAPHRRCADWTRGNGGGERKGAPHLSQSFECSAMAADSENQNVPSCCVILP